MVLVASAVRRKDSAQTISKLKPEANEATDEIRRFVSVPSIAGASRSPRRGQSSGEWRAREPPSGMPPRIASDRFPSPCCSWKRGWQRFRHQKSHRRTGPLLFAPCPFRRPANRDQSHRATYPSGPKASNITGPEYGVGAFQPMSVHTRPTCVGSAPSASASKVKVKLVSVKPDTTNDRCFRPRLNPRTDPNRSCGRPTH